MFFVSSENLEVQPPKYKLSELSMDDSVGRSVKLLLLSPVQSFLTSDIVEICRGFKVKVKVTLRLTVYRQSVCLGAKPLEDHDQISFCD
jgi:hypothetical protein